MEKEKKIEIPYDDFKVILALMQCISTDGMSYDEKMQIEAVLDRMVRKEYALKAREAYAEMQWAKKNETDATEIRKKEIQYMKMKGLST